MPECYADTLLIQTLVPTLRGYNHKHSCFKVESSMKESDKFAVGIIDNDKKQIKYLSQFNIIDLYKDDLILWKHKVKHHYIIQICPALEKWILKVCEMEGIDLVDFELENDLDGLKRITKSLSSMYNKRLEGLFKEIRNTQNESVGKLKGWIDLLKVENYRIDINDLKNV